MDELAVKGYVWELVFRTPFCVKYKEEYIQEFYAKAIFSALFRRIMMMDYFVESYIDQPELMAIPAIVEQKANIHTVPHYSARRKQKIYLKGVIGRVRFKDIPQECLPYVLAGEILARIILAFN